MARDTGAVRTAVAYLGPEASYTHQATLAVFPGSEWELTPVTNMQDVFDAVADGRTAYGVVPFENSTHGPVMPTLTGLADHDGTHSALRVCGETYLAVHHCLLGRRPENEAHAEGAEGADSIDSSDGKPLCALDHITRVYSHPQAFGQTAAFARRYLPTARVEMLEASSTSRAAVLAAADTTGHSAAISSALAAKTTGLAVLAHSIEDDAGNTTRFFVLKSQGQDAPPVLSHLPPTGTTKTLVSFTVSHRSPGALADVLACFRLGGLNLTSINSVPIRGYPFQYLFFVEFEHGGETADTTGTNEDPAEMADARVQRVLLAVAGVAQTWRLLGTWPKPQRLVSTENTTATGQIAAPKNSAQA